MAPFAGFQIDMSGENLLHDMPMHVRQPEVAAAEAVRQAFVVDAQKVQDGGVQIVHRADALSDVHAEVVGGAVDNASLDAAAGEPDAEAFGVMIAAVAARGVRCAAELAGPEYE